MLDFLLGKKTFILAGLSLVYVAIGLYFHFLTWQDAMNVLQIAGFGVTLRKAIS